MAGEAIRRVIAAVIAIAVISLLAFGVYNLGWPLVKQSLGFNIINTTESAKLGISPFNQFTNELKACAQIPDNDCLCPTTAFTLPANGMIIIDQDIEGTVKLGYYAGKQGGSVRDQWFNLDNFISGCDTEKDFKSFYELNLKEKISKDCTPPSNYVIEKTMVLAPLQYFGDRYSSPVENKQLTASYIKEDSIALIKFDSSFYKTESATPNANFASSIDFYLPYRTSGRNTFNLQALYKKSKSLLSASGFNYDKLNQIYLIPTATTISSKFSDSAAKEELDKLNSLKKCSKPQNFDQVLNLFLELKKSVSECSSKNVLAPEICDIKVLPLPENYSIMITSQTFKTEPSKLLLLYKDPSKTVNTIIEKFNSENKFYLLDPSTNKKIETLGKNDNILLTPENPELTIYSCPEKTACFTHTLSSNTKISLSKGIARELAS